MLDSVMAASSGRERTGDLFVHGAGMDHSGMDSCPLDTSLVMDTVSWHWICRAWQVGRTALDSVDAMADWLARVIEISAAHAKEVTVVGHSMGEFGRRSLAARHPERIDRLVLLGTSAPMPVADVLLNAAQDNDHAAIDMANT